MTSASRFAVSVLVAISLPALSFGQASRSTQSQRFGVYVPPRVSVTAPAASAVTFDRSSDSQSFPEQRWEVSGNSPAGITVLFSTDQAFTLSDEPSQKRDAAISVQIGSTTGRADWTVKSPAAQTDYATGIERAAVSVASDSAGRATLELNVTFLTAGELETLREGDYSLTVTATVTTNE